jgi:hypothetical protein
MEEHYRVHKKKSEYFLGNEIILDERIWNFQSYRFTSEIHHMKWSFISGLWPVF